MRGNAPDSVVSAALARVHTRRKLAAVGEQLAGGAGKLGRGAHHDGGIVVDQRAVGVGEVLPVGTGDDGGALAHGLDRVLPAAVDQRAADEGHGSQLVEHAELADGVGDVGVAGALGQRAERAARHVQPLALQHLGDGGAALGMARGDDGAQIGQALAQLAVRLGDDERPRPRACWRRPAARGRRGRI